MVSLINLWRFNHAVCLFGDVLIQKRFMGDSEGGEAALKCYHTWLFCYKHHAFFVLVHFSLE